MAARWRYGPFDPKEVFKGDFRGVLGPLFVTTSNAKAVADTEAFIAYLDARSDVAGDKIGAVGFCMGGGMAIAAAGTWPDRFAAVVSFHDGNLATEAADSPHGYAPKSKADPYIAAAENDATYPPAMAEKIMHTLEDAQVSYRAETYPAPHGCRARDRPWLAQVTLSVPEPMTRLTFNKIMAEASVGKRWRKPWPQ